MTKKVFALVSGIVGALQTAGVAVVTYVNGSPFFYQELKNLRIIIL